MDWTGLGMLYVAVKEGTFIAYSYLSQLAEGPQEDPDRDWDTKLKDEKMPLKTYFSKEIKALRDI